MWVFVVDDVVYVVCFGVDGDKVFVVFVLEVIGCFCCWVGFFGLVGFEVFGVVKDEDLCWEWCDGFVCCFE